LHGFIDLVYVFTNVQHRKFFVVEVYTTKFADLIGAINCSIYEAVARCRFLSASSAGVFPYSSLAFGSAPASIRALMISSGAPLQAA
jgi:hypothetical protein